ncbi:MAG: hypothetical protein JNK37_09575 [Verrucomicrobiales bacterium]|nr:hypothetical protein [Verrucomicrobiales bacterium]
MKFKIGKGRYADVVWDNASKWIGEVTESNASELALNPTQHFETLKAMLPGDWQDSNVEGKFLSALGFSLARAITLTSNWRFEFVLFEESNFRYDDGVWSIVSEDCGTLIFPIGILYRDYYKKTRFSGLYAEAIYSGRHPRNPPNSFIEWEIKQAAESDPRD